MGCEVAHGHRALELIQRRRVTASLFPSVSLKEQKAKEEEKEEKEEKSEPEKAGYVQGLWASLASPALCLQGTVKLSSR